MANVNVARGMRDLLPETMRKRRAVIQRIEHIFRSYGFDPLETPAVERIETLMGKYGDEGSKLIFKILARGEAGDRGRGGDGGQCGPGGCGRVGNRTTEGE